MDLTGGLGRPGMNSGSGAGSKSIASKPVQRDNPNDGVLQPPPPVPPFGLVSRPEGHASLSAPVSVPVSVSVPVPVSTSASALSLPTLASAPMRSLPGLAASGAIMPGVSFTDAAKLMPPPVPPPVPAFPPLLRTQLQVQQKGKEDGDRSNSVLGFLPVLTTTPATNPVQKNNQPHQSSVVASFTSPPAIPTQAKAGKNSATRGSLDDKIANADLMDVDTAGGTPAHMGDSNTGTSLGSTKIGRQSGRAAVRAVVAAGTGSTSNRNAHSTANKRDDVLIIDGGGGGGKSGDSVRGAKVGSRHFASPELTALKHDVESQIRTLKQALDHSEEELASKEEDYISKTWAHGNVIRGWDARDTERDRINDRDFIKDSDKDREGGKEKTKNAGGDNKEQQRERERSKMAPGSASATATAAANGNKHRRPRLTDRVFSLSSSSSSIRRQHPDILTSKRNVGTNRKRKKRS